MKPNLKTVASFDRAPWQRAMVFCRTFCMLLCIAALTGLSGVANAEHLLDTKPAANQLEQGAGQWTLDAANSALSFITVKAGDIAEAHRFGKLSGEVTAQPEANVKADGNGEVTIQIHLDSVETNIPIRNERIREHLFDTANYPVATVQGALPLADYLALANGDSITSSIELMLDIKTVQVPVAAEVVVSRLATDRIMVVSSQPIIINASGVGLVAGIDKLQQLASLPSISKAVPVSFVLTFAR